MNKLFLRYAEIEAQIAVLEAEKSQLKPVLEKDIARVESAIVTPLGSFQKVVNKVWTYSDYFLKVQEKLDTQIVALREDIKTRKLKAQLDNRATYEPVVTFRFIGAK